MKKLRKIIGNMIMLLGVAAGLYVGLWLMFIRPIIETAAAFDNDGSWSNPAGIAVHGNRFCNRRYWNHCRSSSKRMGRIKENALMFWQNIRAPV